MTLKAYLEVILSRRGDKRRPLLFVLANFVRRFSICVAESARRLRLICASGEENAEKNRPRALQSNAQELLSGTSTFLEGVAQEVG